MTKNVLMIITLFIIIVLMTINLGLSLSCDFYTERSESRIFKLEESMAKVQKNIITHDEIIFKNWALLYEAINMPQEEIDKLKEIMKIREAVWAINH